MFSVLIFITVSSVFIPVTHAQYMDEADVIIPPSFSITSVEQNVTTQQVVVTMRIGGGIKLVPLLYMSKVDWTDVVDQNGVSVDQSDVNIHPCQPKFVNGLRVDKTCCLEQFVTDYQAATDIENQFASNENICDADGLSVVTNPSNDAVVFSSLHYPEPLLVSQLLQDATAGVTYDSSLIVDTTSYEVVLKFTMDYLETRTRITEVPNSVGTFTYQFFVGCVFLGLQTQDKSINTIVVQENIEFTKSDVGFFSVSTEQDRSAIKSVDAFIHQAKADITTDSEERLLQYVEVDFRYDVSQYESVTVDRATMRYSRATTFTAGNAWDNVCKTDSSDTNSFVVNTDLYDRFATQTCLPYPPVFCGIQSGRFTFPLSLEGVTNTRPYITQDDVSKNIFIIMQVTLKELGSERLVPSTVYATINLASLPILEHCTSSVFDYNHVTDIIDITIGVGLNDADNNLINVNGTAPGDRQEDSVVRRLDTVAPTYGAASINVVIDGSTFFRDAFTSSYKFRVDNMVIMNFLGASSAGYDALQSEIAQGNGFRIEKMIGEKFYTLKPSNPNGATHCTQILENDIVAANWACMWRRVIKNDTICDPFQESVYFLNDKADEYKEMAKDWVKRTFFNVDMDTNNTDAYLKARCPKFYDPLFVDSVRDFGDYGCMFIDPGYRWLRAADALTNDSSITSLTISDKTVVAGIITIVNVDGKIGGRRLLTMNADGSGMNVQPLLTESENKQYSLDTLNNTGDVENYYDRASDEEAYGGDDIIDEYGTIDDRTDSDRPIQTLRQLFGENSNKTPTTGFFEQGDIGLIAEGTVFSKNGFNDFMLKWNMTEQITTSPGQNSGSANEDQIESIRRRLLSDKHRTSDLFTGKNNTTLAPAQIQHRLDAAFSMHQMQSPIKLTREDMQVRLKASFARHNYGLTKLNVRGNHALSRHLLSAGDRDATVQHMNKLKNESASELFEISNPFSVASVSIASFLQYNTYQMFSFDIEKKPDVNMDVFMKNVNFILNNAGNVVGDRIVKCSSVTYRKK